MVKLIAVLFPAIFLNYPLSSTNMNGRPDKITKGIELAFSEDVLRIEGGEPVYPSNTKIMLHSDLKTCKEINFYINDGDLMRKESMKVDLSTLHDFKSGSYTIVVECTDRDDGTHQEIFGFFIE